MSRMGPGIEVRTLKPGRLDAESRALWARFRAEDARLASPYFDLRYVLAAAEIAPQAEVAVIRREGRIVGFLPFQRRYGLIQPIAAPMTDYHGLIAAPGADISLKAVVEALGAGRFRFSGLAGEAAAHDGAVARPAMIADLSKGFDAYAAARPAGFLKDKRRRLRRLEEAHGLVTFSFGADPGGVLDFVLKLKREQLARTGQHDPFASSWTEALLRRLAADPAHDFGLRFAAMWAGDTLIAAEVGLLSGDAYHLWFPVYEPDFAKYSPGALMTLETLRALAARGVATADFGPGAEPYKADFADAAHEVLEGDVITSALVARTRAALGFHGAVAEAARRLDRRWDRIAACEPHFNGQARAASENLKRLGRRHPKTSIGVGLGAAASLGLLGLLAD